MERIISQDRSPSSSPTKLPKPDSVTPLYNSIYNNNNDNEIDFSFNDNQSLLLPFLSNDYFYLLLAKVP